jgi:diaminohydroxyphosphoribosylaminopyrimidine deaminase/5-amino-6-(5-phosphoribosylamino)uracil reductase
MPADAPLLNEPGEVLWVVGQSVDPPKISDSVTVHKANMVDGKIDLAEVVDVLGSKGLHNVMIEAGSGLAGAFVQHRIVDKVAAFIAPKIIGGTDAPGPLSGLGISDLDDALSLENATHTVIDGDILVEGYVSKTS